MADRKTKWIVLVIVLVLIAVWGFKQYNGIMTLEEGVKSAWSQVENVYQRRADLIPNLVATVKGYAAHESKTLTDVIDARARATRITVDPKELEPEEVAEFQKAQSELSGALGRLLVSVEQYPDLKANQNFLDLQAQLEGTENRITVERKKFNDAVQAFNTKIRKFPVNIIASFGDFEQKGYFRAEEGAEKAPEVSFE